MRTIKFVLVMEVEGERLDRIPIAGIAATFLPGEGGAEMYVRTALRTTGQLIATREDEGVAIAVRALQVRGLAP